MEIVINILEKDYECLKKTGQVTYGLVDSVLRGTPLPQNLTNGDVIKAMFPKAFFDDYVNQWDEVESVVMDNEIYFDIDWWNAPYKTESEEKER